MRILIDFLKIFRRRFIFVSAKCIKIFSPSSKFIGPPKDYYESVEKYINLNPHLGSVQKVSTDPLKKLATIKGGRICLRPWAFLTKDDKLLFEESNCYNSSPTEHWIFQTIKLPTCFSLMGKSLFLSSRSNYWHTIADDLSHINLLRSRGITLDDYDHIICEKPSNKAVSEVYKLWNIQEKKLVSLREHKHIEFEEVSFFSGSLSLLPVQINETRNKVLSSLKKNNFSETKNIIVGRGDVDTRKWINQSDCQKCLESEFDFQLVESSQLTFTEQAYLFQNTKIVVGVHGAGLTNIIFMKPGSYVIELRYKKQKGLFSSASCYEKLSKLLSINHIVLHCNGVERKELKGRSIEDADIFADINQLSDAVKSIIQGVKGSFLKREKI